MPYFVTGTLRKGIDPGTVECELRDDFGVVFYLTGVQVGNEYQMTGVPGEPPEGTKLPWEE